MDPLSNHVNTCWQQLDMIPAFVLFVVGLLIKWVLLCRSVDFVCACVRWKETAHFLFWVIDILNCYKLNQHNIKKCVRSKYPLFIQAVGYIFLMCASKVQLEADEGFNLTWLLNGLLFCFVFNHIQWVQAAFVILGGGTPTRQSDRDCTPPQPSPPFKHAYTDAHV